MKPKISFLMLALGCCGCNNSFSVSKVSGQWKTQDLAFYADRCGIADALEVSISTQVYNMGTDESGEIYDDEIQPNDEMLTTAQENLWSHCDLSLAPGFYCPFPIQVLHFDAWKDDLQDFETTYNCLESTTVEYVSGYTQGIFIDENTAYFETDLTLSCVSDTINQEELSCYSIIGANMKR